MLEFRMLNYYLRVSKIDHNEVLSVLCVFFVMSILPFCVGVLNIYGLLKLLMLLLTSQVIGKLSLDLLNQSDLVKSIVYPEVQIFTGLVIVTIVWLLFGNTGVLFVSFLGIYPVIKLLKYSRMEHRLVFDWRLRILLILMTFLTLYVFGNWSEITSKHSLFYSNGFQDFYFWTALSESIKEVGFIGTLWDSSSNVTYHFFANAIAAMISDSIGVSSHSSLWSLLMPVLVYFGLSFFKLDTESNENRHYIHFLVLLLTYLFLIPINPLAILRGDWQAILWFGSGFTPLVTPAWSAAAIFVLLFINYLRRETELLELRNFLYGLFLMVLLTLSKSAVTPMLLGVYFVRSLLELGVSKNFTRLKAMFLYGIILIPIYIFYFSSDTSLILYPGQIIKDTLVTEKISGLNFFRAWAYALAAAFIWVGIKWVVIVIYWKNLRKYVLAFITLGILCLSAQSCFRFWVLNNFGEVVYDKSHDIQQFLKALFFIGGIGILKYIVGIIAKKGVRSRVVILFSTHITICIGILYFHSDNIFWKDKVEVCEWAEEVLGEIQPWSDYNKAMVSNWQYSGQYLTARGLGNFLLSIKDADGGYTSFDEDRRHDRFDLALSQSDTYAITTLFETAQEVVFISNPLTLAYFKELEKLGYFKRCEGTKWLFYKNFNNNF